MKQLALESAGLTLERVLEEAAAGEVVFLTSGGEPAFALVKADESDAEICALRSNAKFMAFLAECEARARTQPRKTLDEFRKEMSGSPS